MLRKFAALALVLFVWEGTLIGLGERAEAARRCRSRCFTTTTGCSPYPVPTCWWHRSADDYCCPENQYCTPCYSYGHYVNRLDTPFYQPAPPTPVAPAAPRNATTPTPVMPAK